MTVTFKFKKYNSVSNDEELASILNSYLTRNRIDYDVIYCTIENIIKIQNILCGNALCFTIESNLDIALNLYEKNSGGEYVLKDSVALNSENTYEDYLKFMGEYIEYSQTHTRIAVEDDNDEDDNYIDVYNGTLKICNPNLCEFSVEND